MTEVTRRCAIYTRKSSEEGLEQSFNSLHAQREACEAYIKSQAHEGWRPVKAEYDDGGFSGGSMERPALKRLMADVTQRLVDIVVVYKVDRLTRSLADFAKIVEILDGHDASFVSVTQQFNTTTSMGRLTLNVLLSFAQFEREVAGERIRDKIAASKRRGMWMGGAVTLGYDVKARQLVINAQEAHTARHIFTRYIELGSVAALQSELVAHGILSKVSTSAKGVRRGGTFFTRTMLYHLLSNPTYAGRIPHNGESYPGQHEAIIESALWEKVQGVLAANKSGGARAPTSEDSSPLGGILFDDGGNLMSPSHCKKRRGRRYRYYVSQAILQNEKAKAGSIGRVPAAVLERIVADTVRQYSSSPTLTRDNWHRAPEGTPIRRQLDRVTVSKKSIEILFRTIVPKKVTVTGVFVRRGRGLTFERFDSNGAQIGRRPSIALVKALCRAHHWLGLIERGEVRSYYQLARLERMNPGYVRRVMQLAFLAPSLVDAAIAHRPLRYTGVVELTAMDIRWCPNLN